MNVQRLRQVRDLIVNDPRHFDMADFTEQTDCGTTCCIGGHAAFLAGFIRNPLKDEDSVYGFVVTTKGKAVNDKEKWGGDYGWEPIFRVSLGLTVKQAERLFVTDEWPEKFAEAYNGTDDSKQKAQAAAERINHFIRTRGRE